MLIDGRQIARKIEKVKKIERHCWYSQNIMTTSPQMNDRQPIEKVKREKDIAGIHKNNGCKLFDGQWKIKKSERHQSY